MEEWQYDTAKDLDQTLVERLSDFPREPEMMVYVARTCAAAVIRGWLKLYHRLEIVGRENLPAEGSFVVVANHTSHLDTASIMSAFPFSRLHRVFPAAAQDYFFSSVPRVAFSSVVVNALPFDRHDDPKQSLQLCRQLLRNSGNVLVIFPEGTRTTNGEMGQFKLGVGFLVAGEDFPVVPCRLDGAFDAWRKGTAIPRPHKIRLAIGRPRKFSHLEPGKEAAMDISSALGDAVRSLASEDAGERP